ncbi:helix-turn-helix transcriptional regulator [Paludicola sp. MB14-C6]|uniref:helix-turn-helix domain-containing protein n=1 Tax=Paludihabitans sp. MB14-C6 TaxID=3070656 RepID=UPI0027DB2A7A|nr:helix-turn-helix transcriptional regulator [Paludicola sp. MB14-C6]WMJ22003.1 helix-turn-helix transcriptional regulator [Paludicola sp. MB14-C6]
MEQIQISYMIATRRKQLAMTQQQIADQLGVTNKAVSKWETGDGYPDITIIPALAEILQITTDELLTGEKSKLQIVFNPNAPYTKNECIHEFSTMKPVTIFLTVLGVILAFCFWIAWQSFAWSFGVCGVLTAVSLFCRYVAFIEFKNKLSRIGDTSVDFNELKAEEYNSVLWNVWLGITPLCYMIIKQFLIGYLLNPAPDFVHLLLSWLLAAFISLIITIVLRKKAKGILR